MTYRNWQVKFSRAVFILFSVLTVVSFCAPLFAFDEDAGDDDPDMVKMQQEIAQKRERAPGIEIKETVDAQRPKPTLPAGTTLIRELKVTGSTIIAKAAIEKLKGVNLNRELTGADMQRIADKITRAYSRHGYITSYAYVVPDKLAEGMLEIMVVEGKTGKIEITGNRNFSTDLLRKKITLKEGKIFNFRQLNIDLYRMNRHMDRKASVKVDAGTNPGFSDVLVSVKDKLPLHVTLAADNYGADTILYYRFKSYFIHNNLTGHDDSLTAKVELSRGDAHKIYDLDYILPINNKWKFELYMMPYKVEDYYQKDNRDTDFEKRARKWYVWLYQSLINEPDTELISSYGFTFMDIFWYKPYVEYENPTRMDRFRIFKWDLSLNKADKYGRWIVLNDLQKAVAGLWGANRVKSDAGSVVGAKGDYMKNLLTVARRQKLAYGVDFFAKSRWQLSSCTLTGVNAFSAGGTAGVIDNRGFPRTQAPADEGRSLSLGFSFPAYLIPKNVNVPYSKTKLFDSLKLFTFWDWSQSILKSPKFAAVAGAPHDKKITTLKSAGFGLTFNVPDQNLAVRVETGFALSPQEPIDGERTHTWFSVTKTY
jgi:hemolysin activation/secretion protein